MSGFLKHSLCFISKRCRLVEKYANTMPLKHQMQVSFNNLSGS